MNLILKVHRTGDGRKLVCITDENLIGTKVEENQRQLDFSSAFYKGEPRPHDLMEKHIKSSYMTIFSGKEAIAFGEKLGFVDMNSVLRIGDVPQAQVLIG